MSTSAESAAATIEPFTIAIPEAVLDDLRARLARTRAPAALAAVTNAGIDRGVMEDLLAYWRGVFDWRRTEAALNRWPQFTTTIDGLRLHFVHQRSPEPDALPLVVTHGWPGSIVELQKILGPLTDPVAHGGARGDAFHVVCPSIPGYGFSEAPRTPGFDVRRVGETIAALMQRLGYARWGAQGGDWGAMATPYAALAAPEACCGIHLNMVLAPRPPDDDLSSLSPFEAAGYRDAVRYMREGTAYQGVQTLEPDTLAWALADSPAGLAAWIVDKFRRWCDGELWTRFTRDEILANVTLYWVTGTIASSMRLYLESRRSGRFGPVERRVDTPTGCALFPREIFRPPRRWVERLYDVRRWTEMPEGGHFAALEVPHLLVEDVRAFFRPLRPGAAA